MTATTQRAVRPGGPGSAPPLRAVTDAQVARHIPLVHHTLRRLYTRNQIAPHVEYDDLAAVGAWAVWEALRRWKPEKGTQSTYISSYIWGYVMKYQRDATRANGWSRSAGESLATVVSYEETLVEDLRIADTLAAPDDTEDDALWAAELASFEAYVNSLPTTAQRAVGRALLEDRPIAHLADELGVSRARCGQVKDKVVAGLRRRRHSATPRAIEAQR